MVRSYSCACVRRPAWLCTSLCVCVATAAGRFAAKRREQGWLCARLSDTVHNRVVRWDIAGAPERARWAGARALCRVLRCLRFDSA